MEKPWYGRWRALIERAKGAPAFTLESRDDPESTLLSETGRLAMGKCGVWQEKNMYGKRPAGIVRIAGVVDGAGKVTKAFPRAKVDGILAGGLESR